MWKGSTTVLQKLEGRKLLRLLISRVFNIILDETDDTPKYQYKEWVFETTEVRSRLLDKLKLN